VALFRKKAKSVDAGPEARSPKTGIKYKDLDVVNLLVKHGADLIQPRHVLYYLYFPSAGRQGSAASTTAGKPPSG
jgi:hypothetical protein